MDFMGKSKKYVPGSLKRGSWLNYSGRFPEGVQKVEDKQWRQARSRPGENETLNIMLRGKYDDTGEQPHSIIIVEYIYIYIYIYI